MNRRQPMAGMQQRGGAAAYGYKLSMWLRQVLVELGETFMWMHGSRIMNRTRASMLIQHMIRRPMATEASTGLSHVYNVFQ